MSATASREKGHFSFLSHTSSRNIIPSSVCADQILGRRKGARLGGGQTKVHIPASQGTLALLPPPAVPFSSVNGDTEATVMSCSCIQQVVRGGCGQEGALVRKAGTHSQPWTAPRISDSAHGHLQAHTSPKPKTKLDPTATLPSGHPPGARHVIHLSSLRLPHRAGLEPRSSLYTRTQETGRPARSLPASRLSLGSSAGGQGQGQGSPLPGEAGPSPRACLSGCGRSILRWCWCGVRCWLRRLGTGSWRRESDCAKPRPCRLFIPGAGHVAAARQPIHTYWPDIATPARAGAPPAPGLRGWSRRGHMTLGKQSYL